MTVTPQATGEEWTVADSRWGTQSCRCTFDIEVVASLQSYWFADISVYNFLPAAQQVIQKGDKITVEAGYESPSQGAIFSGRVFQPIWERANETDYRLTLHCFIGLFEDETGYVSDTFGSSDSPVSEDAQVRRVAELAGIGVEQLDPILAQTFPPRGKPFAGRARAFFDEVARSHQLVPWIGPKGVNIRSLAPTSNVPNVVYAPPQSKTSEIGVSNGGMTKYTLIGTPQQTEEGVRFRTLLDSGVGLGQVVKLDQALLRKLPLYPGQDPIRLDKDGLFIVGGIRYAGDTRGNEWYSEILGITPTMAKITGVVAR